jgi:hypothetical protein
VTIKGARVALEKVVQVPGLRTVTHLRIAGILAAAVAGLLAGCGGGPGPVDTVGDGIPSPTRPSAPAPSESRAADLLRQAREAFLAAPSVHVSGTAVRGADAFVVDARLKGSSGGTATVRTSGEIVDVIRIGDDAYVGGDLAFWRAVTGDGTRARAMVGTYVRTGAEEPDFAGYVAFTQPSTYAEVLPDPARPATLGATTVIRGTSAIAVHDQSGSTLYVAGAAAARPLRLDGLTSGQVVFLDFADYGARVPLRAPASGSVHAPGRGS